MYVVVKRNILSCQELNTSFLAYIALSLYSLLMELSQLQTSYQNYNSDEIQINADRK
jgi:hypothetical protein